MSTATNPIRTGSAIFVPDATGLAALDATNLNPGTRVRRQDTDTDWVLTLTDSGGVAVSGYSGLRWIEDTGGGGGTVDTDGTLSGDGSSGDPIGVQAANVAALQAVTSPAVTGTVAGSAVQNVDLDLSALGDGDYEVTFTVLAAATCSIYVQPNSVSTNQRCANIFAIDGASPELQIGVGAFLYMVGLTNGYQAQGRFFIRKVGSTHLYHCDVATYDGSSPPVGKNAYIINGTWDVATAITGLRIHSDTAASIGVTSVFTARRQVLL
jgi:hypothetical protein